MSEDTRRGGYWIGPVQDPHYIGIRQAILDLEDTSDVYSAEDALAIVLVGIEPAVRALARDSDNIATVAELAAKYGVMPTYCRDRIREILSYMDAHDEIQDITAQ